MAKWTPDKVEEADRRARGGGVQGRRDDGEEPAVARSSGAWARRSTRSATRSCARRASCSSRSATSACRGGGANIFRGHDNVQGATDVGPNPDSLPGYYGIADRLVEAFRRGLGRRLRVDQEAVRVAGDDGKAGHDGVALDRRRAREERADRPGHRTCARVVFWGHAPNSQTRGKEMIEAMKKLDLLVVIDPYPSATAAMAAMVRKDGVYLLPAATQFETSGSVTASNRSLQWREKVIEPLFESRTDHMIMYQFAQEVRLRQRVRRKNYKLREAARAAMRRADAGVDRCARSTAACWTIGYTGQSPERLKAHMRNMHVVRREDAARQGRQGREDRLRARRRLLRPAVAVLRHAGAQAPGLAEPVRHVAARDGRRRQLPRQLRRRARRRQPARRGRLVLEGRRHHDRLSRVRPRAA